MWIYRMETIGYVQDLILFEANIGSHVCKDELALSQGEFYMSLFISLSIRDASIGIWLK